MSPFLLHLHLSTWQGSPSSFSLSRFFSECEAKERPAKLSRLRVVGHVFRKLGMALSGIRNLLRSWLTLLVVLPRSCVRNSEDGLGKGGNSSAHRRSADSKHELVIGGRGVSSID